jgi:hypothetical protein
MHPFKIRLAFDNGMYVVRPKMIQNIGEAGKKRTEKTRENENEEILQE